MTLVLLFIKTLGVFNGRQEDRETLKKIQVIIRRVSRRKVNRRLVTRQKTVVSDQT